MKYRTRAVEIIAHRIGDDGWPDEIWQGVTEQKIILHLGRSSGIVTGHVVVNEQRAEIGEYIVRSPLGHFFPLTAEHFHRAYEPSQ